jgi:hypothetical protein
VFDPATRDILDAVFRRESQSLLLYARHAFPWTAPADRAAWERLRRLIALLIRRQRQLGDNLERDLGRLAQPEARLAAHELLEKKRQHLKELIALAQDRGVPVPAAAEPVPS